jgi:hypothetical protein
MTGICSPARHCVLTCLLAGGIGRDWYRLAYIRRLPASACSNGSPGREGMFPETCEWSTGSWQYPFSEATRLISSRLERIPTNQIGPATTMEAPGFVYAVAQGNSTGLSQRNCITVTLVSNVALTSGATSSFTKLTIAGLQTSMTSSTEAMDLYQDTLSCIGRDGGAPTPGLGILRSGALQTIEQSPKKDQAKYDQAKGTLEFQLDAGQYIQAGELMSFTFALQNPDKVQDNQVFYISGEVFYCDGIGGLCPISSAKQLSIPKTPFAATSKDPKTLKTEPNTFVLKDLGQATLSPDKDNLLFVTLMPNKVPCRAQCLPSHNLRVCLHDLHRVHINACMMQSILTHT